jgi:hypothetical protein
MTNMIKKFYISLSCLMVFLFVKVQYRINEFIPKIRFKTLDSSEWILTTDELPTNNSRGVLMFKHNSIIDSFGRPVEPVIAILYENIKDSIDVIEYSIGLLGQKPFKIKHELLGGYPELSSDKYSIVFRGEYLRENVKHLVMIGYILSGNIGIEIIGDATEEIYPKVESDLKDFLKSVNIKQ